MVEIIRDIEQGSPEWYALRGGIPTASRFKDVLAKGEGKTRKRYLLDLAGERLTGEYAESYSNAHMERGKAMEAEARALYCFQQDCEVEPVSFIRNGVAGCSPDGMVGNGLVEIKTKIPALQLECLMAAKLPSEHVAQCQGALWVCEKEWIDFASYWPKLPLFVIRVYRDEKYIANLVEEITKFNAELAELVKRFS